MLQGYAISVEYALVLIVQHPVPRKRSYSYNLRMPQHCGGMDPTDASLETIKKDHAESAIPMGICNRCGRKVVARNKSGRWVLDSHDKPPGRYRSSKRGSK